jgi:hypothetical protein
MKNLKKKENTHLQILNGVKILVEHELSNSVSISDVCTTREKYWKKDLASENFLELYSEIWVRVEVLEGNYRLRDCLQDPAGSRSVNIM